MPELALLHPERVIVGNRNVSIRIDNVQLQGDLILPESDSGLVLFAHGSGSSRHSPRNQFVASALQRAKVGTLLFDLLTAEEEAAERETRHLRFDIPLLARRLMGATRWVLENANSRDVPLGYFGSSTGAAAALLAAGELGEAIRAVVSRGGRPDLAGDALNRVTASTLLIVGGNDPEVLALNEEAYAMLHCERSLRVVPGAGHLFEEPGKLELVASIAADWFRNRLKRIASS